MTTLREKLHKEVEAADTRIAYHNKLKELYLERIRKLPEDLLNYDFPYGSIYSEMIYISLGVADEEGLLPISMRAMPSALATAFNSEGGEWRHSWGNTWELQMPTRYGFMIVMTKVIPKQCFKALVQTEMQWCGDPPSDVTVLEYLE